MKRKRRAANAESPQTRAGTPPNGESEWLPRWAPYVIFALLAAFLFREFIVSNGMLFGTDVIALGYFARLFYAEMIRTAHTFPLWNPYVFGGLPFVDAMHGDIFYPTTVLKFVMPVHRAMGWKIVLHVFLAGVVTYGWLRHLRISRPIAVFGGITYMLAPVMVTLVYPGQDGKLFVTALTPLALWTTDWAVTRGGLLRFAMLAVVVALLVFTAHMQLAYYATWALVALVVFRLVQARREGQGHVWLARRFGGFALAGIVGALLIGAVQLWTPLLYLTKYSQRVEKTIEAEAESAYARATSWSLHPEEALSLVVPEFIGVNFQPLEAGERPVQTYWGRNPFKLNNEYGGLIPLLLLPLAFITRRRRGEVWLFTGIAAASLIYALGATTPLFQLFYWLIPGVKLFRAPSSIMFVFAIAVVTAAALGLEGARQSESDADGAEVGKKAGTYLWAAAGAFLVLALLGSTGVLIDIWRAIIYSNIAPPKLAALQANLPNIKLGLWLSFLLAGLLAGAWQLRRRGSLPQAGFIAVVALLSIFDLMRVDPQFIRVVNPASYFPRDDTTEFLIEKRRTEDVFRVFALPNAPYQPNHFALYGLEELAGHHGNELGRYMEMIAPERLQAEGLRMFRLLNVRYIVSGAPIRAPGLREVFEGQRSTVYELRGTGPRAFLVSGAEVVPDSLALDRLLSASFVPWETAILDSALEYPLEPGAEGQVRWLEWGVNSQALEVEASGPALLVISDNYYPAWRATVDGKLVPVLRADYSLRAVPVPAGSHEVRFEYYSPLFQAAVWTSLLSTLLVAGLIGASVYRRRRGSSAVEPAEGPGV